MIDRRLHRFGLRQVDPRVLEERHWMIAAAAQGDAPEGRERHDWCSGRPDDPDVRYRIVPG